MKKSETKIPADYIMPIAINGLHGRVLRLPAKQKKNTNRQILMLYGHHASLERMFGIIENLADYGTVTMPDLPGFGGMDSFYTLGTKPTLDNLADYLATFIKLNYKKSKITIGAMSFGFVIVTKMLQKYPDIASQVDILISLVGFSSKDDFKFKKKNYYLLRYSSWFLSGWLTSNLVKYLILQGPVISTTYKLVANKHAKMKDADIQERDKRIKFEIVLWKINDPRTYFYTSHVFLNLDQTHTKVDLPVLHISVDADQYFNNRNVKKHLNKIYRSVTVFKAKMANHAPTVISNAKEAEAFIPKELRKVLSKKPKK
jgi:pimeloyl-ACP methyl ester carboxylesterase